MRIRLAEQRIEQKIIEALDSEAPSSEDDDTEASES